MFNMTEELNQLIFKYNLDKYYPQYRKRYKAEKIIDDILYNVVNNGEKTVFVSNDDIVLDIVKINRAFSDEYIEVKYITDIKDMENVTWQNYSNVYILSLRESEKYGKWFRMHGIKYAWLYDIFEVEGIIFEKEFYKLLENNQGEWFFTAIKTKEFWKENLPLELYFQKMKYEYTSDERVKAIALEKAFFIAIIMKNFLCAEKMLLSLKKNEVYIEFWEDLQELLSKIRSEIAKRKQKDVIWQWMDGLSYERTYGMPYLEDIMSQSVVFENAFTTTPYTEPTLIGILCKKMEIDDKGYKISLINEENSDIINYLSSKGYDFRYIGCLKNFGASNLSEIYHGEYDTASAICWDVLENIINNPKPMVIVGHLLNEIHDPNLSVELEDNNIGNVQARIELGKRELDSQLSFYDEFMNDNIYRIYMSDHGLGEFRTRFHIHWNVYNKNLGSRKVKGLLSTLDLAKTIENIIEDRDIESEIEYRDYIKVQNFDLYSKYWLADIIKNHATLGIGVFGYQGVITRKYMYIKFRMGKEWFIEREKTTHEPSLGVLCDDLKNIENKALLQEFRSKIGDCIEDSDYKEKCKYSVYLYKIYDNYLKRCRERMDIICEAMKKYPKGTIALRMGGDHSAELYFRLQDEYKEKIGYIIDNNAECVCKNYGVPILTLEEAKKKNIKAVVLSSYNHLDMLRKEALTYSDGIDIIDIYKELETNGICCKDTFYIDVQLKDEDYDVGFPFDELD